MVCSQKKNEGIPSFWSSFYNVSGFFYCLCRDDTARSFNGNDYDSSGNPLWSKGDAFYFCKLFSTAIVIDTGRDYDAAMGISELHFSVFSVKKSLARISFCKKAMVQAISDGPVDIWCSDNWMRFGKLCKSIDYDRCFKIFLKKFFPISSIRVRAFFRHVVF